MISLAFSLLFLTSSTYAKDPLKILVYNVKFAHSHSNYLGNIADILVEEGHQVTSLIPEIFPAYEDGTTKSRVIRVPMNEEAGEILARLILPKKSLIFDQDGWDKSRFTSKLETFRDCFHAQCNATLHHDGLIDQLRNDRYDVMIAETFDQCSMGIYHLIKPKSLITVSTTQLNDYQSYLIGQPILPSHVPAAYGVAVRPDSILSRIENIFDMLTAIYSFRQIEAKTDRLFKNLYGPDFPDLGDLTAESTFVLANSDPFLDFARPTLRKVVEIGGITLRKPKKLEQEWDDLLNHRKRTFLITFGSIIRAYLMPLHLKKAIAQACALVPNTTFIWKYEKPEEKDLFAEGIDNLIVTKWMPQNDLLGDVRVNGILTHAGKGSFFEVAASGKPSLLVPIFGDQYRNAASAVHAGFGKLFSKLDLVNPKKMAEAVESVMSDPVQKQRSNDIKNAMEARPFTARDLLVRHVEFAGKMGPQKPLNTQGRNLSYIVYYNIDILIGAIIVILSLVISVFALLSYAIKCLFKSGNILDARKKND